VLFKCTLIPFSLFLSTSNISGVSFPVALFRLFSTLIIIFLIPHLLQLPRFGLELLQHSDDCDLHSYRGDLTPRLPSQVEQPPHCYQTGVNDYNSLYFPQSPYAPFNSYTIIIAIIAMLAQLSLSFVLINSTSSGHFFKCRISSSCLLSSCSYFWTTDYQIAQVFCLQQNLQTQWCTLEWRC
jgi:hypothetical protein